MRPDTTPQLDADGQVRPPADSFSTKHSEAAADITRQQIDTIYATQDTDTIKSPHDRTHADTHHINEDQWSHYHSSWQQYYQQYYGRYYASAYEQSAKKQEISDPTVSASPFTAENNLLESDGQKNSELSRREAMNELRSELLSKVKDSATKARGSRHFIPAAAAAAVLVVFLFIQYNSALIAYAQNYVSPGNIAPENIIANPNLSVEVSPEPRLIIPKINVDIAVDYTASPDHDSQMAAMRDGVAYFGIPGANSKPGQLGNVPISGHSSNDFTESGSAKFVFARLEQLGEGDVFYLNYEGTRYTYTITRTVVVLPSEVSSLQIGEDKPHATLITCTPLGTAEKRFLAFAEQISPSPSQAEAAPSNSSGNSANRSNQMAGTAPTLFERAFGAN